MRCLLRCMRSGKQTWAGVMVLHGDFSHMIEATISRDRQYSVQDASGLDIPCNYIISNMSKDASFFYQGL